MKGLKDFQVLSRKNSYDSPKYWQIKLKLIESVSFFQMVDDQQMRARFLSAFSEQQISVRRQHTEYNRLYLKLNLNTTENP